MGPGALQEEHRWQPHSLSGKKLRNALKMHYQVRRNIMLAVIVVLVTIGAFVVLIGFIRGCERLQERIVGDMNSLLEYILVGLVTLGVLIYLVVALLAPEKF
jgi:K+-transporting ATPase KdpF subunit